MQLDSTKDIYQRFGISEVASLQDVRKELKELIRKNHPDATPGGFASSEQEVTYHDARQAAAYIDDLSKQGIALLPASPELLKVVQSAIQPLLQEQKEAFDLALQSFQSKQKESTEKEEQESKRENAISKISELETSAVHDVKEKIKQIRLQNYVPKVTFSILVAALTLLWFLPQRVSNNQAVQQIVDVQSPFFVGLWVTSFLATAATWLVSWYLETRYSQKYTVLTRGDYQETLFKRFMKFMDSFPIGSKPQRGFSKSDLTRFIYMALFPTGFLRPPSPLQSLTQRVETVKRKSKEASKAFYEKRQPELNDLRTKIAIVDNDSADAYLYKFAYEGMKIRLRVIQKEGDKVDEDMRAALRGLFLEFKDFHMKSSLFPQLTQTFDPLIAAQLAEIILEKAVLKENLRPFEQPGTIDDWFE